jgi:hypothetical protein
MIPSPEEDGMAYDGYVCFEIAVEAGVANVVIDHPPINLFDAALLGEMGRLSAELGDDDVRLVDPALHQADITAVEGLLRERDGFDQTLAKAPAQARMQRFMEIGGQTPEGDKSLDTLPAKLADLG